LEYWERQQVEPDRVEGDGLDVDADEMVRGKVLKKALEIINGERQDSYGNPEDSFALIAEYWSTYLRAKKKRSGSDTSVYPIDVAEMMALFKIARMSGHRRQQPTTMQMQRGILGSRGIWYEH
jgi:hypothetical protein